MVGPHTTGLFASPGSAETSSLDCSNLDQGECETDHMKIKFRQHLSWTQAEFQAHSSLPSVLIDLFPVLVFNPISVC